jgi:hypothetical protein
MQQENKTYMIDGREFDFKSLTIDELTEVNKIVSKFAVKGNEIKGDITGDESKRFLWLALKPLDGKPVEESFFGKTEETMFLDIFTAFFLRRISSARNTASAFASSIAGLTKL